MLDDLKDLLDEYIDSPDNPDINMDIAVQYENLGQLASAITFYLRAAEFGFESAPAITYVANIKVGELFERFTARQWSASNAYLHAIAYQPNRPEAYFYLSRFYERTRSWQESYTYAVVGQQYTSFRAEPTVAKLEYLGDFSLIFQQAVAGWWVGRQEEAKYLFERLINHYPMPDFYVEGCKGNLRLWDQMA